MLTFIGDLKTQKVHSKIKRPSGNLAECLRKKKDKVII